MKLLPLVSVEMLVVLQQVLVEAGVVPVKPGVITTPLDLLNRKEETAYSIVLVVQLLTTQVEAVEAVITLRVKQEDKAELEMEVQDLLLEEMLQLTLVEAVVE
mgnify:CR=1 FL=1